ncbi:hypothetical protein EDI28_25890 [Photobacterium chitinilyticum]|uniref:Uncharacterized protein n=1 Tax=Photobacterium chitinilyticum TaxID=2485123 RepID=A0A3S4THJ6_9GAMM|nr:hypothetical protein EDI28_25890 [Photobacterium chitinilyticum]
MTHLNRSMLKDRFLLITAAIVFVIVFFFFSKFIGAENVLLIFIGLSIFEHLRNIIKTINKNK